ncbi:MAG: FAD/NAD(P)-binding protein [Candidatus Margulisbacteria bacterium]|nr:FAD/NAD(P)-binding protein [Candidatus Margulisiibacteriota bacterium]MBU1022035.1 FAD/NAD(P)-binding protein [Candidatus Margulisiibacteriota bacterium]MBU1729630.1 FAD/NAD(P)-binding protein [Candidatus Margulisiibacteriota bacterium]MBU1954950.1 FAD/NAD(P)-binding protein [Candidatus Margulisiibacteriota bacterium]
MKRGKYKASTKPQKGAAKNEYLPRAVEITKIRDLSSDVKHYTLKFKDGKPFEYKPGQFVQVSIFGVGEAPISITSTHERGDDLEIAIRRVGSLTNAIHTLKEGDELFIRGPYGNSFPWEAGKGKDILFIAGGIGLLPLRSVMNAVFHHRKDYGKIWILYGAKSPQECVYADELARWGKLDNVEVLQTVDSPTAEWKGGVGVVTTLFEKIEFDPEKTISYLCGPPIMIKFTNITLEEKKMQPDNIITTMEMHMKCGIGKCGHCLVGHKYCCTDGPVFTFAELKALGAEE